MAHIEKISAKDIYSNHSGTFRIIEDNSIRTYKKGKLHSLSGPAWIAYSGTGRETIRTKYDHYINGIFVPAEEFDSHPAVVSAKLQHEQRKEAEDRKKNVVQEIPPGFTGYCILERNQSENWLLNGKHHRVNGPAIIMGNYKEYWINGRKLTEAQFAIHPVILAERLKRIINDD